MAKIDSKWKKVDCDRIIREQKDFTAWFTGEYSQTEMWEMFRYRMGFGEAESAVLLAALIKVGAKFK